MATPCSKCETYQIQMRKNPFGQQMCLPHAEEFCAKDRRGCGQSCPGCRSIVAAETTEWERTQSVPIVSLTESKAHWKCGRIHPYKTPCPSVPSVVPSMVPSVPSVVPSVPSVSSVVVKAHWKCGQFHPYKTPCPSVPSVVMSMVHSVPSVSSVVVNAHRKCGRIHPYGTPC